MALHSCINDTLSNEPSWWEYDGRGIPLCRVCAICKEQKLSRYRPEVLKPYTQEDVDEPIEPDDDWHEQAEDSYYSREPEDELDELEPLVKPWEGEF